jgi:hypothetical protein
MFLSKKTAWEVGTAAMIFRYIDEGVVGSDMGLFLIVGYWQNILPQYSKGAN